MDRNRQRDELSPAPWVQRKAAPPPSGPARVGVATGALFLAVGVLGVLMIWIWSDGPASNLAAPIVPDPINLIPVPELPALKLDVDPESRAALDRGVALMNLGRHTEALPSLRDAVRLNPEFAEARYRLGLAMVLTGDLDGARHERTKLADIDPSLGNLLGNLIR